MFALGDGGLPYRRAVIMVVFNQQGDIFVGKSTKIPPDGKTWQMPQGGVNEYFRKGVWHRERPVQAAHRELKEEIGATAQFVHVRTLPERYAFDFLDDKTKYRGQILTPVLLRCLSPDRNFDLSRHEDNRGAPAFSDWKWAKAEEVLRGVTAMQREIYAQVLTNVVPMIAAATMTQRQRCDAAGGETRPGTPLRLPAAIPLSY
ncbi:MAG: NUDIX domain-containing protein [Alphaproteobacteria bacterium]